MSTQETELSQSTKSNDNVTVIVTRQPNCLVKFELFVTPRATTAAYIQALKNVNKEVSIPGFRKGKAPDRLIIERYSSQIHKEWVDTVLQTGFNEAVHLTHLQPLKDGILKRPIVQECSQEKGAKFILEFETKPAIPSVKVSDLQLKKIPSKPVTDLQREQALENILGRFTDYEPIEERAVQKEDFVDLNVDTAEDPPRHLINNQRAHVTEKGLPKWILEKVIGLKAGESIEGETEIESSNPDSNTPAMTRFRITVNAIWKGVTPAIDDELAKRTGLKSIDELHKKIEEKIKEENDFDAYQHQVKELENCLIEKYPLEIPQSLVNTDKENRLKRYKEQLKREDQEEYWRVNQARIEENMEKSSRKSLQLYFLMHRIATEHGLTVSEHEINEEFNKQISLLPTGLSNLNIYDQDNIHFQLETLALERKVNQFLLDKATFIEG